MFATWRISCQALNRALPISHWIRSSTSSCRSTSRSWKRSTTRRGRRTGPRPGPLGVRALSTAAATSSGALAGTAAIDAPSYGAYGGHRLGRRPRRLRKTQPVQRVDPLVGHPRRSESGSGRTVGGSRGHRFSSGIRRSGPESASGAGVASGGFASGARDVERPAAGDVGAGGCRPARASAQPSGVRGSCTQPGRRRQPDPAAQVRD